MAEIKKSDRPVRGADRRQFQRGFTPLEIPRCAHTSFFRNLPIKSAKFLTGFTLPELMLVVGVIGVLAIAGSLKFVQMRDNIRIDQTKARMKALQTGLKMYYDDVGMFPSYAKSWGLGGYSPYADGDCTAGHWNDYLIFGYRPGWKPGDPAPSTTSDEDEDKNGYIDNWCGKYVDSPDLLRDTWGHRFIFRDYSANDLMTSGILCMGPQGVADGTSFGAGTSPGYANYLRSNGSAFTWKSATKDSINPPDEEGFSVFPLNGNSANLKTDFIMVLWME